MGTLNPLPNMFTQTSLLFSVEAWMVDDLLVRNAQRELDMMGNNLFQVVVEQMGQLDQCIQLLEEINALRRELLTILPQLVHAPENVNTNALLHRVCRVLRPVQFLPLHWNFQAPLNPFLSEFPSLECVTKIWREDTILDVIFPPLVETPALIRSPGGTLRVGMQIITRWDLDVTQQRIFRARLTPLQDVNHQEQCVTRERTRNELSCFNSVDIPYSYHNFSMKIVVWNCRGASRPSFIRVTRDLIRSHQPTILAILETRLLSFQASGIISQLGFSDSICVDPEGFSGGLYLLWNSSGVDVQAVSESRLAVHAVITAQLQEPWILSTVYNSSNPTIRKLVWDEMRAVASLQVPWVAAGDFNVLLDAREKCGGKPLTVGQCKELKQVLSHCNLIDVGAAGPRLTWNNKRTGMANIRERLDRVLANEQWIKYHEEAQVKTLSYYDSDHRALLVDTNPCIKRKPRPYRLEAIWTEDPRFTKVVSDCWISDNSYSGSDAFLANVCKFQSESRKWNKKVFGNLLNQISDARVQLIDAQLSFEQNPTIGNKGTLILKLYEYLQLLKAEELYWKQKSRNQWLREGDLNTRFFPYIYFD